jgi:alkylated DNA repair dioxygenase AlkB
MSEQLIDDVIPMFTDKNLQLFPPTPKLIPESLPLLPPKEPKKKIHPHGGCRSVSYHPKFFPTEIIDGAIKSCWELQAKDLFKKYFLPTVKQMTPRYQLLMGDSHLDQPESKNHVTEYTYSRVTIPSIPWTPEMKAMRDYIYQKFGYYANAVFINLYMDGSDYLNFHADQEKEMGDEVDIFSVNGLATRNFDVKMNEYGEGFPHLQSDGGETYRYELEHNSLLIMYYPTNAIAQHCIRKTTKPVGPRFNWTFRNFIPEQAQLDVINFHKSGKGIMNPKQTIKGSQQPLCLNETATTITYAYDRYDYKKKENQIIIRKFERI